MLESSEERTHPTLHAGARGRDSAADSAAFRTRSPALVHRNSGDAGPDFGPAGADFAQPGMVPAGHAHIDHFYLPQLFFGLISLILLFNIYLLSQKRTLNTTRLALIRELVLNERLESLSLIDPLTQLLNRRALNELVPREVARANRLGSSLTFMAIDLNGFSASVPSSARSKETKVLIDFAKILKTVFRGADLAFRQGGDEFLIMMPDTTEEQADCPGAADAPRSGPVESGQQEGLRTLVQLGPGPLCHRAPTPKMSCAPSTARCIPKSTSSHQYSDVLGKTPIQ